MSTTANDFWIFIYSGTLIGLFKGVLETCDGNMTVQKNAD